MNRRVLSCVTILFVIATLVLFVAFISGNNEDKKAHRREMMSRGRRGGGRGGDDEYEDEQREGPRRGRRYDEEEEEPPRRRRRRRRGGRRDEGEEEGEEERGGRRRRRGRRDEKEEDEKKDCKCPKTSSSGSGDDQPPPPRTEQPKFDKDDVEAQKKHDDNHGGEENFQNKNSNNNNDKATVSTYSGPVAVSDDRSFPTNGAFSDGKPFHVPAAALDAADGLLPGTIKAARRQVMHEQCANLKSLRYYMVTIPSDICELLPFLESYIDECDIVAEAGSRLGTSTTAILNRHPKKFASLEIMVHNELRQMHRHTNVCHKNSRASDAANQLMAKYETSATGKIDSDFGKLENFIVEGDDIKMGLPWPKVEFLFIDTLHNADQLWKELQTFPKHVTKWIAFHDSHSFKNNDENVGIRRNDVPARVSGMRGLRTVVDEFLRENSAEWVEEMNYVHNFGFFVIRRRSWKPTVFKPDPVRVKSIQARSAKHNAGTPDGVAKFMNSRATNGHESGRCSAAYAALDEAGKQPHPVLCGQGYSQIFGESYVRSLVAGYREADIVPVFAHATIPMGYAIAAGNIAFILNPQSGSSDLDFSIDFISFFSAFVGAHRQHRRAAVVCINDATACNKAQGVVLRAMTDNFASMSRDIWYETSLPPKHGELVVLSAKTLASFSNDETFGQPNRIMVTGTAVGDATKFAPKGYEIKTAFNEGMGLAVWEKIGSTAHHYV